MRSKGDQKNLIKDINTETEVYSVDKNRKNKNKEKPEPAVTSVDDNQSEKEGIDFYVASTSSDNQPLETDMIKNDKTTVVKVEDDEYHDARQNVNFDAETLNQNSGIPSISALINILLGNTSAIGAGIVTHLLHNERKISQDINLMLAALRSMVSTYLPLVPETIFNEILGKIAGIVINGSYFVTTMDVNKNNTIFTTESQNFSWNEFPNHAPLIFFQISTVTGILSGIIGLSRITLKLDPKFWKNFELALDFICPAAAFIGGATLFAVKGLASTIVAPIAALVDGGCGTFKTVYNWARTPDKEVYHDASDGTANPYEKFEAINPVLVENLSNSGVASNKNIIISMKP